jgi:hypothetical protein
MTLFNDPDPIHISFDDMEDAAMRYDPQTNAKMWAEYTVRIAATMVTPAVIVNGICGRDADGKLTHFQRVTEGKITSNIILNDRVTSRMRSAEKRLQKAAKSAAGKQRMAERMAGGFKPSFAKKGDTPGAG